MSIQAPDIKKKSKISSIVNHKSSKAASEEYDEGYMSSDSSNEDG
jgi:hypothetical protein